MKTNYKYYFSLLVIFLIKINHLIYSQAPDIQWQKALGGSGYDNSYSICEANDGGFVVAGDTWSNDGDVTEYAGSGDFWIVKLNFTGEIEWEKSYGGSGWEESHQIIQTNDFGFLVVGFSTSSDGDLILNQGGQDFWILKLDETGNIQWQKTFGGSGSDNAYSVQQTIDGGFIVAGLSSSIDGDVTGNHGSGDFWIVKINGLGDLTWQQSFGGPENDYAKSIKEIPEEGYIVTGYSESSTGDVTGNHGESDYWVIKISEDGTLIWQNSFGGTDYEFANSLCLTADNSFLILGYTLSNNGDVFGFHGGYSDYWLIKLNNAGTLMWQKCFGGGQTEEAFSIYSNNDSTFILAGYSGSNDGDVTGHHGGGFFPDYWIVNIDSIGNINWQKSLGGNSSDEAFSIIETTDSSFIATGWVLSTDGDVTGHHGITINRDFWIVKLGFCTTKYFVDFDGDGYGDPLTDSLACELPIGYVTDSTDCNDANNLIYPTAEDICNAVDDNCNGLLDEDAIFTTWYKDLDGDNFGDVTNDSLSCFELIGYVIDNTDCNDLNGEINPSITEICNDIDDNCNLTIDEGLTIYTLYVDADGDEFGDPDIFINSCLEIITGYVSDSSDCDDSNNTIYPGAMEICDYLDNDCDGVIDDNLIYIHSFEDADGDNYGNINIDSLSCSLHDGFVEDDSDCDDTNASVYPGADEILNGIDDNCNELTDEGLEVNETSSKTIIFYPNPTNNLLFIKWPDNEEGLFQLINSTGEIVGAYSKTFPLNEIDVSQLASGVYLLRINNVVVNTFIKD